MSARTTTDEAALTDDQLVYDALATNRIDHAQVQFEEQRAHQEWKARMLADNPRLRPDEVDEEAYAEFITARDEL